MFEAATWKIMFGAVGVLALLGIPVVFWMRRRALKSARRSGHAWGGVLEDGSASNAPDGWEDISSRFIDDFIPDVDEDQQETAHGESVRVVAGNSPGSLDDAEEGVRVIEEERREVVEDEVPPPEDGTPPEVEEKPAPGAGEAPASEPDAPWWEGLSEPLDAEYPRGADESPAAAPDEPPGSRAQVDREARFEDVLADEEIPEAAEANPGEDVPMRMRIPAVSEVRDEAVSGDDSPDVEQEGEEEVLHLTPEGRRRG